MALKLKPYPEYKESGVPWLGKIPSGWAVRRAKFIFRTLDVRSKTGSEELLTVSARDGVVPRREKSVTMFMAESYVGHKLCWPGDLVINSLWAWAHGLGFARHFGIVSSAYGVYQPRPEYSSIWMYLDYLLRAKVYERELRVRSKGIWISRLQLTDQSFLDMPILLPQRDLAVVIARFLSSAIATINGLIRAKLRLIELLNEQKQAIIHHAVTRGLDPNVRLKPSGIDWLGDVPEHWEVRKIKALLDIRDGTHDTPPYVEPGVSTFPLVTTKFLGEGRIFLEDAPHISEADYSKIARRSYVSKYDVIMPMIGTVGNPVVVETDLQFAIKNIALFRTAASRRMLPEYLCFVLKSNAIARQMADLTRGGVQDFVGLNTLRNLILAVPSPEEQRTILRQLRKATANIAGAINAASLEVKLINEYRTCLIADIVTGKLDVRGVKLEEVEGEADFLEDFEENEAEIESDKEIDAMEGLNE